MYAFSTLVFGEFGGTASKLAAKTLILLVSIAAPTFSMKVPGLLSMRTGI